MPRRDILNDDLILVMAECVRKNMTYKLAAQYAEVDERTFYRWRMKGEEDIENNIDTVYSRLCLALKKAEGDAAQELLELVKAAGQKINTWTAAAWLLERRHREGYSQNGDKFEKLEAQIAALGARFEKRQGKSVGAKLNDETLDSGSHKTQGRTSQGVTRQKGRENPRK